MDFSVIICTYNRANELRRTLKKFCDMQTGGLGWELILVDNNSRDDTKSACQQFEGRLPMRYVFEARQGKSAALNRAIAEASAPLLLFTDDDVDVDPEWSTRLWNAARRYPGASFFGGKVLPRWEKRPPKWLEKSNDKLLRGLAVHHDRGELAWQSADSKECYTDLYRYPFIGANFALQKSKLAETGIAFCVDIGPNGNDAVRGEETMLQQQLMERGLVGCYVPDAVLYHRNSAARMTERYVREWYKGTGIAEVRLKELPPGESVWFDAPRYLWRQFLESAIRYGATRWTRSSQVWLAHECRMATTWGSICEFRKMKNRKRRA
jgi:cellulose synthase/poly-beta-1,6-N-acetylglucosamine synthase-like glycosyltransferase